MRTTKKSIKNEIQVGLMIRRLSAADAPSVARLADLDSAPVPHGPLLGIEVEGKLVAAVSLDGGESIADPFSRTAEVRALLELRAAQLRRRPPRTARFRIDRRPARASLAGSPPGAGGRLLTLPIRPY